MNHFRIKKTIVCKDIGDYSIDSSIVKTYSPKAGDVGIFEILELGKHLALQGITKRYETIIEGDRIMAAFGNRYASDQFEGYVPSKPTEILDILAIGGVIGILKSKHEELKDIEPTTVRLIGYVKDINGNIINSKNYSVRLQPFIGFVPNNATVILSVGSTMGSGKTTSAGFCARGLTATGKKVAFIKLTGTAHTKDKDLVYDCGADITVDFTDAGYPSTFLCDKEELLDLYQTLLHMVELQKPDFIIIEIADGVVQRETEFLLQSKRFTDTVKHVLFSGSDSLGVLFGIEHLTKLGLPPVAVSGVFTMSPLLVKEVNAQTSVPVLTIDELMSGEFVDFFTSANTNLNKAANGLIRTSYIGSDSYS